MTRILWADDEIELLKPHVMFLEKKGYEVTTVQSGNDAIDVVKEETIDIVFLDEICQDSQGLKPLTLLKKRNQASQLL